MSGGLRRSVDFHPDTGLTNGGDGDVGAGDLQGMMKVRQKRQMSMRPPHTPAHTRLKETV